MRRMNISFSNDLRQNLLFKMAGKKNGRAVKTVDCLKSELIQLNSIRFNLTYVYIQYEEIEIIMKLECLNILTLDHTIQR